MIMKEPTRYKLTDSPEIKKVNLTLLPSLEDKYPEAMSDDIYIKPKDMNSNEDTTESS